MSDWTDRKLDWTDRKQYSLFQKPFLLAVGLIVLVIGTPSEMEMTKVKEDWFVCLACQAQLFSAIYSSRRALRIHMTKSKNPKCAQEWSKIKVITRPGDVIVCGASGMGPYPPLQHQQPGVICTHFILCIFQQYTMYFQVYLLYILETYNVYCFPDSGFTMFIPCIFYVCAWYILRIYHIVDTMYIHCI